MYLVKSQFNNCSVILSLYLWICKHSLSLGLKLLAALPRRQYQHINILLQPSGKATLTDVDSLCLPSLTLICLNSFYYLEMCQNLSNSNAYTTDPDQTALLRAVWSRSVVFAKAMFASNKVILINFTWECRMIDGSKPHPECHPKVIW